MITHTKVSGKSDGADNTKIQPSDWNAEHTITDDYALLRVATKTLTNDEVISLPTTSVEILAAPGANKIIIPIMTVLHANWVADYGGIDAGAIICIRLANVDVMQLTETIASSVSSLLTGGGPDGVSAMLGPLYKVASSTVYGISGMYDSDIANKALNIVISGNALDLTGGDAGNTLKVIVYYMVMDV